MLFAEEIVFKDETYKVLLEEKDCLIMKLINENRSLWRSYRGKAEGKYIIKDFQLVLTDLYFQEKLLNKDEQLLEQSPIIDEFTGNCAFHDLDTNVPYTGGVVIVKDFYEDFDYEKEFPCYCYKTVYELIFEEGLLVTAIDHSKAMVRIRMNINKGLRNVDKKKDQRCINKFIKDTLYKRYGKRKKMQEWKRSLYDTKYWNA